MLSINNVKILQLRLIYHMIMYNCDIFVFVKIWMQEKRKGPMFTLDNRI